MVSAELLRRYPFFAGLSQDQIAAVARSAAEMPVDEGHVFFDEGDELNGFYLVLEGEVAIVIAVPKQDIEYRLVTSASRNRRDREVVVATAGPGDVFGWSGLVPPHNCTAGARARTAGRVVLVDCLPLRQAYEEDGHFGQIMTERAAQIMRERLRALRVATLSHLLRHPVD